jgi:ribosomal subunit interface protein
MDIVVKGRNVEVPEHFRQHVTEKLALCAKLDSRVFRLDVELSHEKNPRQSAQCQRVEITCLSKGPVIRAEACADSYYAALDAATVKLEARLRKAHDRRRIHHGLRTPASVAEATSALPSASAGDTALLERDDEQAQPVQDDTAHLIVRDKTHKASAMSVADALHEMELVGHDFYLFIDVGTAQPSVVYRRHGYDYGVVRLTTG